MLTKSVYLTILALFQVVLCAKENKTEIPSDPTPVPTTLSDYDKRCETQLCIPKCCPEGQYTFGYKLICYPRRAKRSLRHLPLYYDNLTESGRHLSDVILVPGRLLDPYFQEFAGDYFFDRIKHNYYITENGNLYDETPNTYNRWTIYNNSQFCVEYTLPMPKSGIHNITLRYYLSLQAVSVTSGAEETIFIYGLLVSCFFLTLVLVVYGLLRELRNLTGKVLMAYVATLLFAFLLLATIKIRSPSAETCKWLTYCILFLLLSSFSWMNVMSCDIWWTFRGYAKARPIHRRGENFKFCMYCCYGFGLPAAMNIITIVLNETDMRHVPWFVTPNILHSSCFISGYEQLFYMYTPMLILIVCNWIFFLMTAFNIWRLHRATAVLDSAAAGTPAAHRSQKYRFLLYLKLSVIMGVNWVLEVVSSFYPEFKGWYISDVYNILIGLSIFLIFVCKKKILRKVAKRLSGFNGWKVRPWYSRSRSSNTTESDVSADAPVCVNPKGPVYFDKR